jgi:hypothetical protein
MIGQYYDEQQQGLLMTEKLSRAREKNQKFWCFKFSLLFVLQDMKTRNIDVQII